MHPAALQILATTRGMVPIWPAASEASPGKLFVTDCSTPEEISGSRFYNDKLMIFYFPVFDFEIPHPSAMGIEPLLHKVKIFLDERKLNRCQDPLGYIRPE